MFKSLLQFQQGFVSSSEFRDAEIKRRYINLRFNRYHDIENVFTGRINTLDIENDENRYLLSGSSDGSIFIHDLNNYTGQYQYTAKCVQQIHAKSTHAHQKSVECTTWFPSDNSLFISSGSDMKLKLWDSNLLKPRETFQCKHRINHHQCPKDGRPLIAVGTQTNTVDIIDLRTGNTSHTLNGHQGSIMAIAWSPRDPFLLVTGGMGGKAMMWDVRSSAGSILRLDFDGSGSAHSGMANGVSFTPSGLNIVTFGSDHRLRLWDALKGKLLDMNYDRLNNNSYRNVQMAVNDFFAFVPTQGIIRVLDLWTGATCGVLSGHFNKVMCCVCRDSYQEVYSGGTDHNILVWTDFSLYELNDLPNQGDTWSSDSE